MKKYINPDKKEWANILARPVFDTSRLTGNVQAILSEVKTGRDAAIKKFTLKFDGVIIDNLTVSQHEFAEAEILVDRELKEAISIAAQNIKTFHQSQKQEYEKAETTPGVFCWQKAVPIQKVGLYIPGGSAPLFSSVLMLAIPAQIAGCEEIILCTPPDKEGKINPVILYAAKITGVTKIYKIGGAQAIAAMAYGTATVPKVDKIFGPGNQYVMAAKQLVSINDVAVDMPAGPSEVAIIADNTSNPAFIAADLLSQAEHGADSQVLLISKDASLIESVEEEIRKQVVLLPRKKMAEKALESSTLVVMEDDNRVIELINTYAPEHLIISTANYSEISEKIINAGSVFLGNFTPESAGDYASGTNHTLPTNGWAKAFSGINLDSFTKKITFQEISGEGLKILGPVIETMAEAEQLQAHKNAVTLRLQSLK